MGEKEAAAAEGRYSHESALIMDFSRRDRSRNQRCEDYDNMAEPEYDVVDDHKEALHVNILPARPIYETGESMQTGIFQGRPRLTAFPLTPLVTSAPAPEKTCILQVNLSSSESGFLCSVSHLPVCQLCEEESSSRLHVY
ncbi:uncharacterized protein V6R79_019258 [Siganus canaliculatus]